MAKARQAEGDSLTDLASNVFSQGQATQTLLQLKAQYNDAKYEVAKEKQDWHNDEVAHLKSLLEEQTQSGAAEEECEETRASLVTAQMQLEDVAGLLQECLTTKKELTTQIEHAEEATSLA